MWLIGLFGAIIVMAFTAIFAKGWQFGFDKEFFEQLKQLLDVLIGPVVALLSSAIGYYFGSQQGRIGNDKPANSSSN